jgi:general secretion pathway protein A
MKTPDLTPALRAFGLCAWPFPKAPEPRALFHFAALDELVARMQFACALRGIALVTGDPGSGKSTALRLFLAGRSDPTTPVIYLADSRLTPAEFYARVLEHFGVTVGLTRSQRRKQFQALMTDLGENQGQEAIILVDEAHELTPDMVQELRYVQNLQLDAQSPCTLILCGQSEIRAQLRLRAFEAVAQRITVRAHLPGLDRKETAAFVQHGLRSAGLERTVFTEAALDLLHSQSRGLIRPIASLATHALLDAAVAEQQLVEETNVQRAIHDMEP